MTIHDEHEEGGKRYGYVLEPFESYKDMLRCFLDDRENLYVFSVGTSLESLQKWERKDAPPIHIKKHMRHRVRIELPPKEPERHNGLTWEECLGQAHKDCELLVWDSASTHEWCSLVSGWDRQQLKNWWEEDRIRRKPDDPAQERACATCGRPRRPHELCDDCGSDGSKPRWVPKSAEPAVKPYTRETFPKDRPVWIIGNGSTKSKMVHTLSKFGVRVFGEHIEWRVLLDNYKEPDGTPLGQESTDD